MKVKPIDTRKKLGERIRELRRAVEITQEELGEKAELNYKYIGELERGKVNVSLDSLTRIADALKVKIGDLFSKETIAVQKLIIKEKSPLSKISSQDLQLISTSHRQKSPSASE